MIGLDYSDADEMSEPLHLRARQDTSLDAYTHLLGMDIQEAPTQPVVPVASTSTAPASIFSAVKDYPTIREGSLVIVYLVRVTVLH